MSSPRICALPQRVMGVLQTKVRIVLSLVVRPWWVISDWLGVLGLSWNLMLKGVLGVVGV